MPGGDGTDVIQGGSRIGPVGHHPTPGLMGFPEGFEMSAAALAFQHLTGLFPRQQGTGLQIVGGAAQTPGVQGQGKGETQGCQEPQCAGQPGDPAQPVMHMVAPKFLGQEVPTCRWPGQEGQAEGIARLGEQ